MRYYVPFLFMQITVLVLVTGPLAAQAQPPRIDPFSPYVGQFITVGEIGGGVYDGKIWPIGDCNGDNLNDWIIHRVREDTLVDHFGFTKKPEELLLFKGKEGQVPIMEDGERIGITELNSALQLLAAGDWNHDGAVDIVMRTWIFNDSSYGLLGTNQYDLVVFWGNIQGKYTVEDTTRLMCAGDAWVSLCDGIDGDINSDGVDDLLIHSCGNSGSRGRLKGGSSIAIPSVHVFAGHDRKRWGREGIGHRADWEWWSQPVFTRLGEKLVDQNCDDAPDIVLYHDDIPAQVSILYGTPGGGLPDTGNLETITLDDPPAGTAQLIDVTGDAVLDLLALDPLSDTQHIRVYPGEPEERLTELYGDGSAPWANFPTPIALHDGWGGFNPGTRRFLDLGDVNRDGTNDIISYTHPFFVSYTAGDRLDSLIDGYTRFDGLTPLGYVNLGNIDGSEWSTIAVVYRSGVRFLHGSDTIAREGVFRMLPHPPKTARCSSTVSVVSGEWKMSREGLSLRVFPNPSNGAVRVVWNAGQEKEGHLYVNDALGREMLHLNIGVGKTEAVWNAAEAPPGIYFITVTLGTLSETIEVNITR